MSNHFKSGGERLYESADLFNQFVEKPEWNALSISQRHEWEYLAGIVSMAAGRIQEGRMIIREPIFEDLRHV